MAHEILAKEKYYTATPDGSVYGPSGNKLKLSTDKDGYKTFSLKDGKKSKIVKVHRFVAYFFLGDDALSNNLIRHLDNNNQNNNISNLLPGTWSENYWDKPKQMRQQLFESSTKNRRRFTDDQILKIRKDLINGVTMAQLARDYQVSEGTMQQIKEGSSYKWVK